MSPKERLVWRYALAFLQAYRPLRYDGIPLAPLLLRHVQRYLNKRTRLLKKGKLPPDINPKHIQKRCAPFFPKSDPDYSKKGFTLVRAQLYLVSKDQVDESFLLCCPPSQRISKNAAQMPAAHLFACGERSAHRQTERTKTLAFLESRVRIAPHTPLFSYPDLPQVDQSEDQTDAEKDSQSTHLV